MSYPGSGYNKRNQDDLVPLTQTPPTYEPTYHQPPSGRAPPYQAAPSSYQPSSPYQQPAPSYESAKSGYEPSYGAAPTGAPPPRGKPYPNAAPSSTSPEQQPLEEGLWRDVPFTVLFFMCLLGVAAMIYLGWDDAYIEIGGPEPDASSPIGCSTAELVGLLVGIAFAGLLISWMWLEIMKRFAKQLIYIAFGFTIFSWVLAGLGFLYAGQAIFGGFAFLVAGIIGLFFWWWRWRIPFTVAMLETSVAVMKRYPAMIMLSFASVVVMAGFSIVWTLAANVVGGYTNERIAYGAAVYVLFSWFWATQVAKNVVHVSCAGVYGTWYFSGLGGMPHNPSASAFKRSMTYSFGSICFGSLLIAIVKTIRALLRAARNSNDNEFVSCCIDCIMGCIETVMRIFNVYAFTQVAIYGKSYCRAAKDTWELFKTNGIDVIVNESMVNMVLSMTSFLAGVATGVLGAAAAWMVFGADDNDITCIVVCATFGFMAGFVACSIVVEVVHSGCAAIIVCFAENPGQLATTQPELHQRFSDTLGQRIGFRDLFGRSQAPPSGGQTPPTHQPGYPATQPGYPATQPGYPATQPGYHGGAR